MQYEQRQIIYFNLIIILLYKFLPAQTGKTTTIRLAAVREAGVSRHHVGPKGPRYHVTVVSRDLRWALNWAFIMPRGTSLLDIRGKIFWSSCRQANLIFFHMYTYT